MTYARKTTVSIERSKAEIESLLARYGATAFLRGENIEGGQTFIEFMLSGRRFRMVMTMPDANNFTLTPTRQRRSEDAWQRAWEQACRQRWRALLLVIKAKLEAVESGISTLEEEFMAHLVLPNNHRAIDWLSPQVDEAYATGRMPPMLMSGSPVGEGR